ncbi:MAG: galactokinase family protein [Phycisphaerae bacterium]
MSEIRLAELTEANPTAKRLAAGGLSAPAAADKAALLDKCAAALAKAGVAALSPVRVLFVPGRIEVLGKHTDYAGGRSVLATAEKGFCVVVAPRDGREVRLFDAAMNESAQFAIEPDLAPSMGHWSNYPMTVARRIARNFPGKLRGADIAFASDLPPAAGMSSSSAMVVMSFLAFDAANDLRARSEYKSNIKTVEDLAGYLGTCENGQTFGTLVGDKGVGTFGGSEDHTAILTCKSGTLNQFTYCPVRFERNIAVPAGYTFAIAASGVVAEKTGSAREKYNRASLLGVAVAEVWREATGRKDPHIAAALASSKDAAAKMREVLAAACHKEFTPAELLRRFEHFYTESELIIPAAGDALARGDLAEFGRQVDLSQQGTDALLCNQIPQTVCLARLAREAGAAAASAFGAGFGGAVWALVAKDKAAAIIKKWSAAYAKAYPGAAAKAIYFTTDAGPCAFEL